jgi:hypothetical protein
MGHFGLGMTFVWSTIKTHLANANNEKKMGKNKKTKM